MLLQSPQNLHYPITVTELLRDTNDKVGRNETLFSYTYKSTVIEGNKYGEEKRVEKTLTTKLESEVEGTILKWKVKPGAVIDKAGIEIAEIDEPCKHDVQFGGMCVACGKDMTEINYGTSVPDHMRANVNMTHGNTALRVSRDEAQRLEWNAKKRLLEARKLSLVVDLDQTIIHATVDPTVGEWMADPSNPNHEAVTDVRRFQLLEDGPCQGNWYYVKLRPGLKHFLETISQLYELHIYTMGTRAYAVNIAAIVDPDKKIFGDRILSRDESGSLTAKSLHRLFPVDTKMVVIIDDRGDVWDWSQNLIKVYPYDFFKGIGDINSSFLPKRQDAAMPDGPAPETSAPTSAEEVESRETAEDETAGTDMSKADMTALAADSGESSTVDRLVSMGGSNDAAAMREKTTEQGEQLKAQIADRPLLQEQIKLEKAEEKAAEEAAAAALDSTDQNGESTQESEKPRHNLLKDDDDELYYLETSLRNVHARFFEEYLEKASQTVGGGRLAELRGEKSPKKRPDLDMSLVPNVQDIMSRMKQNALGSTRLTFSGVIPLGVLPALSETGRWAASFGAAVSSEVTKHTTHVIGVRNHDTAKMKVAARHPRIKIVTLYWLYQVFKEWTKVDETPYVIDVVPSHKSTKRANGRQSSNGDPEGMISDDEDDYEPTADINQETEDLRLSAYDIPGDELDDTEENEEEGEDEDTLASPIDDIKDDDWDDMGEEFDSEEFDESGSESESQEQEQEQDGESAPNGELRGGSDAQRKRKRKTNSETASVADDEEIDADSQLQKRKRQALARTSSLHRVTTLKQLDESQSPLRAQNSEPLGDVEAPQEKAVPAPDQAATNGGKEDVVDAEDEEEDDDGFDENFEAFLAQQLDDEEDNEK